jgi:hypothetical protein
MNKMRMQIIISGIGWIVSGIISGYVWFIAKKLHSGLIYIAILVIITGIGLFVFNKHIEKFADSMIARKQKDKH